MWRAQLWGTVSFCPTLAPKNLVKAAPIMGNNFFENPVQAKRAMRDNLFTEVYLSTAVTTPIQLKGWVSHPNPYERHGQRWHLYLSRVEALRRLAARRQKNVASPDVTRS
jgi:hypothetical protein